MGHVSTKRGMLENAGISVPVVPDTSVASVCDSFYFFLCFRIQVRVAFECYVYFADDYHGAYIAEKTNTLKLVSSHKRYHIFFASQSYIYICVARKH